ncbi:MAG: TadE/TadG family type IV pilus assembly protein [Candidatus Dormiibacterota bacterium]
MAIGKPTKRRRGFGQSLVEFALVLPVLLVLVAGGADLARSYFVGIEVADGARQAVLFAADNAYTYTPSELQSIASSNATGGLLGCPSSDLTVTVPAAATYGTASNDFYTQNITVTCSLPLITFFIHGPAIIRAKSQGLFQFNPPGSPG